MASDTDIPPEGVRLAGSASGRQTTTYGNGRGPRPPVLPRPVHPGNVRDARHPLDPARPVRSPPALPVLERGAGPDRRPGPAVRATGRARGYDRHAEPERPDLGVRPIGLRPGGWLPRFLGALLAVLLTRTGVGWIRRHADSSQARRTPPADPPAAGEVRWA